MSSIFKLICSTVVVLRENVPDLGYEVRGEHRVVVVREFFLILIEKVKAKLNTYI